MWVGNVNINYTSIKCFAPMCLLEINLADSVTRARVMIAIFFTNPIFCQPAMGKAGTAKPSLLHKKLVQQHVKCCHLKAGRCSLCHWGKKEAFWKSQLQKPEWLRVSLKKKVARLGCTFCCLAEVDSPWAAFQQSPLTMTVHALKRHEGSKTHQQAAGALDTQSFKAFAPSEKEFSDALKNMRSGGSARNKGCCSAKKSRIRWCLAEAILDRTRADIKSSSCIALIRDERKGKLLVRYRCCRQDLSVVGGVLGFLYTDPSSDSLAKSTKSAIQSLCTPLEMKPKGCHLQEIGNYDTAVEESLRKRTSILITDSAANEMLASNILAGRRASAATGAREAYFTDVKVIGRDASHATTRVLRRPFSCHTELQQVLDEFVLGRDSFCQKVFHSDMYKQCWKELVGEEDPQASTSVCAAKHRFASYFLPLSRICKQIGPMIKLCHKIATLKSDADWSRRLLKHFTGKKAILLALACDACATSLQFTRFCDEEAVDISELNHRASHFALSIEALFTQGKVYELPTFAQEVASTLSADILIDGQARRVRITQEDKTWALKILQDGYFLNFE